MQLFWGSYSFNTNGVGCSTRRTVVLATTGRPIRVRDRVEVEGWLEADGQSLLSAAQNSLTAALLTPYQDLILKQDDGSNSSLLLLNSTSISGVRCVEGPHFPESDGAEFATLRRFRAAFEAEYVIVAARAAVVSFTERITRTGTGGPVVRYRPAVNAPPVRQQVMPASVITTVLAGSAVGHLAYPVPPVSLWPAFENLDRRVTDAANPKQMGRGFVEYPVSWTYVHESIVPLVGFPRLPPL